MRAHHKSNKSHKKTKEKSNPNPPIFSVDAGSTGSRVSIYVDVSTQEGVTDYQ